MNQSTNNRSAGLLVGILFLLLSLLVNWITIANPNMINGKISFSPRMDAITLTGLNGTVGLFSINLPIWLIVLFGLLSLLFLLTNQRQITSLSGFAIIIPGAISSLYVLFVFAICTYSKQWSIHLGPFLAIIGLSLGFACGLPELRSARRTQSNKTVLWGLE